MQLSARDKEILFADLSELIARGMTFREALEKISRNVARLRGTITVMLSAGGVPDACFMAAGTRFDAVDLAVASAGAESGRLDAAFRSLAEYYAAMVQSQKQVIRGLYYPLAVFHLGVFIIDIPLLFNGGGIAPYLRHVLATLVIFYIILAGFFFVFRFLQVMAQNNPSFQQGFRHIPLVGKLPYQLALWRFTLISGLLTASGLGIFRALEIASKGCKSALIRIAVTEIIADSRNSVPLGEAFAKTHAFNEDVVRFVSLGDASGRLDQELLRAASIMQKDFSDLILLLSKFLPKLIYFAIVIFFMIRMLQTISGVSEQLKGVLDL